MKRFHWLSAVIVCLGLTACVTPSERMNTLRTGMNAEARGEFDSAIDSYTTQLANAALPLEERSVFLIRRAHAYSNKGEFEKAIADADEVIRLRPNWQPGYNARARIYLNHRQFELAISDYDFSIGLQAAPATYIGRGNAYAQNGQMDEALRDMDEAIRLAPRYAEGYLSRGNLHLLRGNYQPALKDLEQAVRLQPDNAEAYYARGGVFGRTGEYEKAYREYSTALIFQPRAAPIYASRGYMAASLGRYEAATADLANSIALAPTGHDVIWLHVYRYKAKQTDTAELTRNLAALSQEPWPQAIASLYLGQLTPDQLRQRAEQASGDAYNIMMCQAVFHGAYARLISGQVASITSELTEVNKICPDLSAEKRMTALELKLIN